MFIRIIDQFEVKSFHWFAMKLFGYLHFPWIMLMIIAQAGGMLFAIFFKLREKKVFDSYLI